MLFILGEIIHLLTLVLVGCFKIALHLFQFVIIHSLSYCLLLFVVVVCARVCLSVGRLSVSIHDRKDRHEDHIIPLYKKVHLWKLFIRFLGRSAFRGSVVFQSWPPAYTVGPFSEVLWCSSPSRQPIEWVRFRRSCGAPVLAASL